MVLNDCLYKWIIVIVSLSVKSAVIEFWQLIGQEK